MITTKKESGTLKYLVTGGAGFIGSTIVKYLLSKSFDVVVLDDLSSGKRENLAGLNVEFYLGSIEDKSIVAKAINGCGGVFHLAALVSVPECTQKWDFGHSVNLLGTINIFDAATKENSIPVVYASSAAIYGNQSNAICDDTKTVPMPISPYGADKLACEHQARAFNEVFKLPSFGLRFFNVFGPNQNADSPYSGVISKFVDNALKKNAHIIFGTGEQTRDFIFVSDVALGMWRAMSKIQNTQDCYVSNLCTGRQHSLLDLVQKIDQIIEGSSKNLRFRNARVGDIEHSAGSIENLTKLLGQMEFVEFEPGLEKLVKHNSTEAS